MRRSPTAPVVVVAAAATSALLVLVATRHGAALTRDSITYLATGRNLVDHHRYTDFTGRPMVNFPPLFALLTFGSVAAARFVNALAAAGIVVVTAALLARHVRSRTVLAGALVVVAVSPVLVDLERHVWSEPLFTVFALVTITVLDRARPTDDPGPAAATAGLTTGLAFLTRYAGLALVPVGIGVFVVRRRFRDAVVFAASAMVLPVLWLVRNAIASSSTRDLMGPRLHSSATVEGTARALVNGGKSLFFPPAMPTVATALALLVVLAFTALALHSWAGARSAERPVAPLVFAGVYIAFIVFSAKAAGADLDARTLAPALPAIVVLMAWVVDRAPRPDRVRPVAAAAVALTALWGASSAVDRGADPTPYPPRLTGLAAVLATLPDDAAIVSNDPWAVYERTRHQPVLAAFTEVRAGLSILPLPEDDLTDLACRRPTFAVVTDPRSVIPPSLDPTDVTRLDGIVVVRLHARTCPAP